MQPISTDVVWCVYARVCLSVCLFVCWSQTWAVIKLLSQSIYCLDSGGPKEPCVRWGPDPTRESSNLGGGHFQAYCDYRECLTWAEVSAMQLWALQQVGIVVCCCQEVRVRGVRTASSSLVSAEELAGSCADNQSVDTGYVSYSTRSLYVPSS